MINHCRLCEVLQNGRHRKLEDTLLFETDYFEVIPTIGQFIPGWLMIVSKTHTRCSRELSSSEQVELESLIRLVSSILEKHYGPVLLFEHGPGEKPWVTGGCCIEHTHIHIVPFSKYSRFKSFIPFDSHDIINLTDLPKTVVAEKGYLMVGTPSTSNIFEVYSVSEILPRQFLRQVLAVVEKCEDMWDWRSNPCHSNIKQSIKKLSKSFEKASAFYIEYKIINNNVLEHVHDIEEC